MRVLVCGDRDWTDYGVIMKRLSAFHDDTIVVVGAARGADTLGEEVADQLGFAIERYPAQWGKYGRSAGPIRNRVMLDTKPDLVIAFHDDLENSKGTKDCVIEARRRRIPVEVITTKE